MAIGLDSRGLVCERVLACFMPLTSVAAAVIDPGGELIDCNEGFRRLLRLYLGQEAGKVSELFVQPGFETLASTFAEPGQPVYSGVINLGGGTQTCRSLVGAVHRSGDRLILLAEYDVAEMERLYAQVVLLNEQLAEVQRALGRNERRLRELSFTDPLTGLANRRRLDEILARECRDADRHGEPFSVILADIDHFKGVNDRHGHDIGDEVLRHFAALLRRGVRETDFAARLGGEEFLVVLPRTGLNAAVASAERLRAETENSRPPCLPGGMTASFGVAQYQDGITVAQLLKQADEALYEAKGGGRNCVRAGWPVAPAHSVAHFCRPAG